MAEVIVKNVSGKMMTSYLNQSFFPWAVEMSILHTKGCEIAPFFNKEELRMTK